MLREHRIDVPMRRLLTWLRQMGRGEALMLLAAFVVVVVAYGFLALAGEVREGETQPFDEWVVRSLRRADDPATPVGPWWLREAALDLTALGSFTVLLIISAVVVGFLLLHRRRRMALLVTVAVLGGMLLNTGLKHFFGRERPSVVPHLREVTTPSFPSGHATLSAVVYLTLGALLAGIVKGRYTRIYCLAVAMTFTALVGASRVYLGVHYPTDVLAGWSVGLAWALTCWTAARLLERRGALREARAARDVEVNDPSAQPAG
jgi:undecaprenyl-diphosphatase